MRTTMLRRPVRAASLLAVTLAVAAPAAASAATVHYDPDGTLVVTAATGERNDLGVQDSGETGSVNLYDSGITVTGGLPAGCTALDDSDLNAQCAVTAAGVRLELGDGDDWGYASYGMTANVPVRMLGGPGDDRLQADSAGTAADVFDGGPGDDELTGGPGRDTLDGGDGDDVLAGKAGDDVLHGGAGDDSLDGDSNKDPGHDVLDGGAGFDTIDSDWEQADTPAQAARPLRLTLGAGADDGRPGEGDDVRSVERVVVSRGGTFTGSDGPEEIRLLQVGADATVRGMGGNDILRAGDGNDTVDGGAGDDLIDAGYGDDHIVGGPGRDIVHADLATGDCGPLWCKYPYGNDTVDVRDGAPDSVTCGAGTDTVQADAVDTVAPDCEHVVRSGGPAACHLPKVRGLTVSAARRRLKQAGCTGRVRTSTRRSSSVRRGRVISAARAGSAIALAVSRGR